MEKDKLYKGSLSSLRLILGSLVSVSFLLVAIVILLRAVRVGFDAGHTTASGLIDKRESVEFIYELSEVTSAAEVASQLEELGVIPNKWLFRLELLMRSSTADFPVGTYVLDSSWGVSEINSVLRGTGEGVVQEDIRVTIPEGYGIREIAALLERQGLFTAEEFKFALDNFTGGPLFLINIPDRPNKLEGYLFPDTYFFSPEATPKDVINRMLVRFEEVFTAEFYMVAEELGMSMDEIVILASMVEREVRVAEERPVVAGVMYNRLRNEINLQIDATILYPMEERVDRVLNIHLEEDTPYNTYLHSGLPIGPIGNPGLACLQAALFPDEHEYLFYVVSNRETGEHHFSTTYEEHLEWSAKYQAEFDE